MKFVASHMALMV